MTSRFPRACLRLCLIGLPAVTLFAAAEDPRLVEAARTRDVSAVAALLKKGVYPKRLTR
jgi:hypothetical protein